ncbi:MAG: ferredoxin family protein [Peptococcaceae bacterium]|nr:ferredoxin family protein [Peptococcaceae bacterium]
MSISINSEQCRGCRNCTEVCPGHLLAMDAEGKAFIKYPKDCWGCTACLKECPVGAIRYFLGPDIGGKAMYVYTNKTNACLEWHFVTPNAGEKIISVNRSDANKY